MINILNLILILLCCLDDHLILMHAGHYGYVFMMPISRIL